ncbi:30S ribosomal protein S14 [bacterium]|nr:30S ribosomal protein S14 [bacterium]
MAKTSMIARNEKRKRLAIKFDARRQEYKKTLINPEASAEDVNAAFEKLCKLPRNASKTRYRNRCKTTGRGRAVYRKFGLCRNEIRRLAHMGQIVGLTKASW